MVKRLIAVTTVAVTATLALGASTAQPAAPAVESYWSCQAVVHPHVHISRPSKGHARKHRCRNVAVDPAKPATDPPGPRPETPAEAHYRVRMLEALRAVEALKKDVAAANARTEQVRRDTETAVRQDLEPVVAEVLELRSWANQLERLVRFLLPFLPDPQRAIALSVMCEERWAGELICQ